MDHEITAAPVSKTVSECSPAMQHQRARLQQQHGSAQGAGRPRHSPPSDHDNADARSLNQTPLWRSAKGGTREQRPVELVFLAEINPVAAQRAAAPARQHTGINPCSGLNQIGSPPSPHALDRYHNSRIDAEQPPLPRTDGVQQFSRRNSGIKPSPPPLARRSIHKLMTAATQQRHLPRAYGDPPRTRAEIGAQSPPSPHARDSTVFQTRSRRQAITFPVRTGISLGHELGSAPNRRLPRTRGAQPGRSR